MPEKMDNDDTPRCHICNRVMSLAPPTFGETCTDPAHWQAAGLLSAQDYYPMAQLTAQLNQQDNQVRDGALEEQ